MGTSYRGKVNSGTVGDDDGYIPPSIYLEFPHKFLSTLKSCVLAQVSFQLPQQPCLYLSSPNFSSYHDTRG